MMLNLTKVLPVPARNNRFEEEEDGAIVQMNVEVKDDVFVCTIIYK